MGDALELGDGNRWEMGNFPDGKWVCTCRQEVFTLPLPLCRALGQEDLLLSGQAATSPPALSFSPTRSTRKHKPLQSHMIDVMKCDTGSHGSNAFNITDYTSPNYSI